MTRLRSCRTLRPARQAGRSSSWRSPFRCARLEPLEQRCLLSAAPVLDSLEDVEVLTGAPLHIALGATDSDGDPLTFSVTVEGNDDVTAFIPEGNRSLRISVEDFGDMVFELFEGRAPNTTARIIALAEAGFYNTTDPNDPMIFHRVIEDFMIQGGDPDGDGTGGSGVTFDDEFHVDLQHVGTGYLSMAKGRDDTDDSQFYITAEATRWLDFGHSIFGFQTEGDDVREAISGVETIKEIDPNTNEEIDTAVPVEDVVINSIEVFTDPDSGVLMLSAPEGASGTAWVTVTVSDGDDTTPDDKHTFQVTIAPDTENSDPFLDSIGDVHMTAGETGQFVVDAQDVEGDVFFFGAWTRSDWTWPYLDSDFEVAIDPNTGEGTVTAGPASAGVRGILIGVNRFGPDVLQYQDYDPLYFDEDVFDGYSSYWDFQFVPVFVTPAAPTAIELLTSSDTGLSTTDGITKLDNSLGNTLRFRVHGVLPGAEVTLFADGVQIIGQTIATGSALPAGTVVVTTDGSHVLDDGIRSITAVQALHNQDVNVGNRDDIVDLVSQASGSYQLTVDTGVPQFTSTAIPGAAEGALFVYDVETDAEAEGPVRYNPVTTWPAGMNIDSGIGEITWTPQPGQGPFRTITVQVTDTAGNQNQHQFEITVAPAPQLDPIGAKAVAEGELLEFTATGTGHNAPLLFSLDPGAPSGATIEGDTGVFRWTPDEAQGPGQHQITVRLTDDVTGATMSETITVTVTEVNSAPKLDPIPDQTAREGDLLQFAVAVADADLPANALTFSLGAGAPQGAAIHPTTGAFTWRPGQQHGGGSFPVTVRVADAAGATDEQSFTVSVEEVVDPRPAELDAALAAWEADLPETPTRRALPDVLPMDQGSLGVPAAGAPFDFTPVRTGQSSIFPDSGLFGTQIEPGTGLGGGAGDEGEPPDGESSGDSTRGQPANTEASPEEPNIPGEDDQSARRAPTVNDLAMESFADDELYDDELFADDESSTDDQLSTADDQLAMALAESPLQ